MGFTTVGMMAAGSVLSAVGTYNKEKSQKQLLETEADISGIEGRQALAVGEATEQASRLRSGALFGRQTAQLAANGVRLDSGSALDVLAGSKYLSNLDAATIHDNATRTAWTYNTQAALDRAGAAGINPAFSAFSTLLGGASQTAQTGFQLSQAGAFGG